MKKLILVIFFLIIMIYLSYRYLRDMQKNLYPFIFNETETAFLYQKKDLVLEDKSDFVFDEYFSFIGNMRPSFKYRFEDGNIIINMDERMFTFPYMIKEKEKEIVEKVVIKEVYKEKTENRTEYPDPIPETVPKAYFTIRKDHFSFAEGTDLSTIINSLASAVESSEKVVMDYSTLNPNEKGTYAVLISSGENSARIIVEIE